MPPQFPPYSPRRRRWPWIVGGLVALTLIGLTAVSVGLVLGNTGGPQAGATASTAPPPDGGTYNSPRELADTLDAGGLDCANYQQDPTSAASATCTGTSGIWIVQVPESAAIAQAVAAGLVADPPVGGGVLVTGVNWILFFGDQTTAHAAVAIVGGRLQVLTPGSGEPAPPAPEGDTIPGDGVFLVDVDIKPGTYRTTNPSGSCYWARLSGTSGDSGEILANDNPEGPTVVTIKASDTAFETARCGQWTRMK
jgi:hypothetical protein